MAEKDTEKDEGEGQETATPAKSKKKLIIIVGASIVLLGLAVGIPLFIFSSKSSSNDQSVEELDGDAAQSAAGHLLPEGYGEEEELVEGEEPLGAFYPLDTFVVNLKGGRYLRAQVQLEFVQRDIPQRFYARDVLVRDSILNLLSNHSADDFQSGSDKESLKTEIKDVVNEIMKKEEVKKVYFTQFLVQ